MTLKMKQLQGVGFRSALSSVEEHFLHTEGVAGSSPAARTILLPANRHLPPNPTATASLPVARGWPWSGLGVAMMFRCTPYVHYPYNIRTQSVHHPHAIQRGHTVALASHWSGFWGL